MDSAEFTEWLAHFALLDREAALESSKADWRTAMQVAMVANTARDHKKRPRPFTAAEFLPEWQVADGSATAPPTDEEVRQAVRAMNAGFGGTERVH